MAAPRLPRSWFEGFAGLLERIHAERPELPPKSTGSTDSVLAMALRMASEGGTVPWETLRARWRTMRVNYPDLVPAFMDEEAPPPVFGELPEPQPAAPSPRTLAEDVELHRHRQTATQATSQLREAKARIAWLEDRLKDLEWAAAASIEPAEWTLPRMGVAKSEHTPHLFTSDFQIGEVIRPEEIDYAHGYDLDTFRTRYRRLIADTVELCFVHQAGWTFPGIIYARGGDALSGGIHEELAQTDEVTPIEAVEICFEEEAAGILHLADAFGRVEVKGPDEGGNHGRDTLKPHTKRASGHSYERLISYMLQREFKNDPRVSFQTSRSPDVFYPIYDRNILQTHGDKIGARGGQGFIGPGATIMRGAQKVIMEQQALGRRVDEVHVGHFHTDMDMGFVLSNGCLPGFSDFAKSLRMRPSPPSQWLSFYSPRFGCVCRKRVYLEEPVAVNP